MKIDSLFPVQRQAIPFILNTNPSQSIYPNDICVTAPTGSGKTLTYALPLIQNLQNRLRPCCRAIVLLPVSDLAEQVFHVFKSHLNQEDSQMIKANFKTRENTGVKCDLKITLLTNKTPFAKEQTNLVNESGKCVTDIVIATPGRLVDHIQKTKGFDLSQLKYLILDECDRIMDQIKQNWLPILNQAVYGRGRESLNQENLNVANLILNKAKLMPLQKLLFSATLTKNPEKLEQIDLFQPVYISVSAEKLVKEKDQVEKVEKKDEVVVAGKKESKLVDSLAEYDVPEELSELMIQVVAQQKPLIAVYLIKTLGYRRMLCFVKSKETASRLNKLFELNGISSQEYSASLHAARRKRVQAKFEQDKLDVLVCSDVMARGMDLANVDYVLLYDAPRHLSSYVHKAGRTARAGRQGTAITLLEHKEIYFFKKMMQLIGNNEPKAAKHKIKEMKIQRSKLKALSESYRSSLLELKKSLKQGKKKDVKVGSEEKNAEKHDEEEVDDAEIQTNNENKRKNNFDKKFNKKIKKTD